MSSFHKGENVRSDSSVGIATMLCAGLSRKRDSTPGRVKNFLFSTASTPALGYIRFLIQRALGTVSSRLKRPAREADHSPPPSAEVKNDADILLLSLKPSWLIDNVLVNKHWYNLTFTTAVAINSTI
jgi:hypothetical protein